MSGRTSRTRAAAPARRGTLIRASMMPANLRSTLWTDKLRRGVSPRLQDVIDSVGDSVVFYTASALAAADQIRAAGREPRLASWEGYYTPPRSANNPNGLPEITVTRVR